MTPQKRTATRKKIERLVESYRAIKHQIDVLDANRKNIQGEVLGGLDDLGIKTFGYESTEGEAVQVTRVQASNIVIDPDALKKAIGATAFNKVTRRVLDTARLEDAISQGLIDPVIVAKCSEEKKNSPYIKITAKESKEAQNASHDPIGRRRGVNV